MDAVGVSALIAAVCKIDGLERHHFLVEDKAQQLRQSFLPGDLPDEG